MFLTNLVYLFHIVFHCILLFVSVAHRDLTVYALINMALLLLLLLNNAHASFSKLSKELKNSINIWVGQAILELFIQTTF